MAPLVRIAAPCEQSLQRMCRSSSWIGVVFGLREPRRANGLVRVATEAPHFEIGVRQHFCALQKIEDIACISRGSFHLA